MGLLRMPIIPTYQIQKLQAFIFLSYCVPHEVSLLSMLSAKNKIPPKKKKAIN